MTNDIGTILEALSNYPRARWEFLLSNFAKITFSKWVITVDDRGLSLAENSNEEYHLTIRVYDMTREELDRFLLLKRKLFLSDIEKNTLKSAANFFAEVARK